MEEKKIKCPYCGEEIMTTAKKCRFCGEWLEGEMAQNSQRARLQHQAAVRKSNTIKYVLMGVAAIAVIAVVGVLVLKTSVSDETDKSKEKVEANTIPPADHPYTIDEVYDKIAEHDANETEEEKANEPWRIHLNKLQGTYLIDPGSMVDAHDYAKYVISGNILTMYSWDRSSNSWEKQFSSEFQLFNFHEDNYMNGYNLIYTDQYGNELRMCSGDLNDDGKMDLWQSDSMFWTKQ